MTPKLDRSLPISSVHNAGSFSSMVISGGVPVLVGLVAGIFPAWKTARLDPVQAVRGG